MIRTLHHRTNKVTVHNSWHSESRKKREMASPKCKKCILMKQNYITAECVWVCVCVCVLHPQHFRHLERDAKWSDILCTVNSWLSQRTDRDDSAPSDRNMYVVLCTPGRWYDFTLWRLFGEPRVHATLHPQLAPLVLWSVTSFKLANNNVTYKSIV